MSEALDEIVDLFAVRSQAVSTKQRVAGQKRAQRFRLYLVEEAKRKAFQRAFECETKRPAPSLPRVKWLERPDP